MHGGLFYSLMAKILNGRALKYTGTSTVQEDRGLRDAITELFCTRSDLLDDERVGHILRTTNSLPYDMVMYWHRNGGAPGKARDIWSSP